MNIAEKLDTALSTFDAPFYSDFYAGDGEDYGYYDEMDETPDGFGDNLPEFEIQSATVHFFTKTNQQTKYKTIKSLLWKAGFRVTRTYEMHENDTGYTHFVFNVETFRVFTKEELT